MYIMDDAIVFLQPWYTARMYFAIISSAIDMFFFFFSSRRRHTRFDCDWSSDVCSSDLRVSGSIVARLVLRGKGRRMRPMAFSDAALLPGAMGIAEEGLHAELGVELMVDRKSVV